MQMQLGFLLVLYSMTLFSQDMNTVHNSRCYGLVQNPPAIFEIKL